MTSGLTGFVDSFWNASRDFHRGITHSLVTGAIGAGSFALYRRYDRKETALAVTVLLSAFGFVFGGFLPLLVMAAFALSGLLVTHISLEYLTEKGFLLASAVGLMSHPFGDLFTGNPPQFLFPFDIILFESRVVLNADPVLNLISVFLLETAIVFTGFVVATAAIEDNLRTIIHPVSLASFFYFFAYLFVPEPTLSVSYQFVFSIIGLEAILILLAYITTEYDYSDLDGILFLGMNMSLTVFLAGLGYGIAYILL